MIGWSSSMKGLNNCAGSSPSEDRLDQILHELDVQRLTLDVEERVHRAALAFEHDALVNLTNNAFLQFVGDFVSHLFWDGRVQPVALSRHEGMARAIQLLDAHYEGKLAPGYAGAYMDATCDEGPGIIDVLTELEVIIAQQEIGYVLAGRLLQLLSPGDWHGQLEVAQQIMKRMEALLPTHLAERPVASLIPAIRELLDMYMSAEGFFQANSTSTETPNGFLPLYE